MSTLSTQSGSTRSGSKATANPLRVLILNQFFPPDFAPTGQLIEELSKHLAQDGMAVEVFTGQPGYAFETEFAPSLDVVDDVVIRRSRISHIWFQRIRGKAASGVIFCLRSFLYLLLLTLHPRRQRPDIVLVTTAPPFLSMVTYLAYRLLGIPYICLLYDLYPDIAIRLNVIQPQHWIATLWHRINRLIWTSAQRLIVLSDSMKTRVATHCPDLNPANIAVIHSWSDPGLIRPMAKPDNWFAQDHQLVDPFTVLYSGNMGRCHDMDTLVDAMESLKHTAIQFVFIGGGAKQPVLQDLVDERGLTNVTFLPYQRKQDLPYSLTACDMALVSVSEDMGDLVAPSKLYSALASGRPIAAVCSPQSYLNSLIDHAHCGATFRNGAGQALADYILYLSRDRAIATQLGAAGRQYMETHFTPQIIAQQYAQVLHNATPSLAKRGVGQSSSSPSALLQ